MHQIIFILVALLFTAAGQVDAQYQLVDNYEGQDFFDGFTFFSQPGKTGPLQLT